MELKGIVGKEMETHHCDIAKGSQFFTFDAGRLGSKFFAIENSVSSVAWPLLPKEFVVPVLERSIIIV